MILLVLGVALWTAAHFFKRLAPEPRAKLGDAGKGIVAGAIVLSIVLMIFGYRAAEPTVLFVPPSWAVHLNNLAMLVAVALLGLGSSKGRMRTWMRHPMLTGVLIWGLSHLLVNGDLPSLVLFGGVGLWAVVQMQLINRAEGPWQPPEPGPASADLRFIGISLGIFAVIAFIHQLVGPWPFPS